MPDGWRRGLWLLPLGLAALLLWPPADPSVEVLGDGAAEIRAALGETGAALPVTVVGLRRMENIRHVPDVARLCRGRCDAALTTMRIVGPRRGAKVLVFDLGAMPGAQALDRGVALPPATVSCIASAIAAEAATGGHVDAPDCVAGHTRLWRLPRGL